MCRFPLKSMSSTLFVAAALAAAPLAASSQTDGARSANDRLAIMSEYLACSCQGDALPQILAAAEAGSAEAQELAGWLYYEGGSPECRTPRDPAQAARWLSHAAEAGRPLAQQLLTALEVEPIPVMLVRE